MRLFAHVRVSIYFLERGRGAMHTWMDSFGEAFKHTYYVTAFAIKTEKDAASNCMYISTNLQSRWTLGVELRTTTACTLDTE